MKYLSETKSDFCPSSPQGRSRTFGLILLLGLLILLRPSLLKALACTPASATITYAADDYMFFYLNGNTVLNGTTFDPGNPPLTVPIPIGDFNAPGTANYYAIENTNAGPNLIACTWLITITCADGSKSYISASDAGFSMYNDTAGSSPPPAAWITPGWVDSGNLFSGTPAHVSPGVMWFNPVPVDPRTGSPVPILSWQSSAVNTNANEVIYYRESVVIPTPPPTPTPYPTVCGNTPAFVQSSVIANGCAGSGNPTSFSYTVPANPGELLLAQVESTGPVLSGVTWNGSSLTQLPGSPVPISGGNIYTYYMVNPPAGTFTLAFSVTNGCSWNVVASVYKNIDTTSPFGAIQSSSGNASNFVDAITTTGPYSIIHDLLAYPSGPFTFTGLTGTQLFAASASGCCDDVYGSYYLASAPMAYNINYSQSTGSQNWWSETIELKAVNSCPTLVPTSSWTATPNPSFSPSPQSCPTVTATFSVTASPPPTLSNSPTRTASATASPTPSFSTTSSPPASPTLLPTLTMAPPPLLLHLYPNSPNPFGTEGTYLAYFINVDATVDIKVYDVSGEMVRALDPFPGRAGNNEEFWDGKNSSAQSVASGTYIYRVIATSAAGDLISDFSKCAALK